jgi:hypothetical protein
MSEPWVVVTQPGAEIAVVTEPQVTTVVVETTQAPEVIVTGMQGPPGPQGPVGPAGDAPTLIAAATLSGHRVLAVNGDGEAIYAQHTDATALAVQGLSTQSGTIGDELVILKSGAVAWPAGGLTPGLPLFLAMDGQLSHTPPSSGWIRQIAVAIDADTISLDIGPAWRAGE